MCQGRELCAYASSSPTSSSSASSAVLDDVFRRLSPLQLLESQVNKSTPSRLSAPIPAYTTINTLSFSCNDDIEIGFYGLASKMFYRVQERSKIPQVEIVVMYGLKKEIYNDEQSPRNQIDDYDGHGDNQVVEEDGGLVDNQYYGRSKNSWMEKRIHESTPKHLRFIGNSDDDDEAVREKIIQSALFCMQITAWAKNMCSFKQ